MIVIDASALAGSLLRTTDAGPVDRRIRSGDESLHAPHLIDLEIAHVVRRYAAMGVIAGERGRAILAELAGFPMSRHPHRHLLQRIWELRYNLSAYDAAYVALAELLDAPLLTRDRKIASAAGHRAVVELI